MKFHNLSPFPALAFEGIDQHDQEFHVVVMRATYDLTPNTELQPAEEQQPLAVNDEYFGEMNKSSVRQESDLVQYKPKCDVIVIGSAYAPGSDSAPCFEVGIRITGTVTLDKKLSIYGPRFWEKRNSGWTLTEPAPIVSLPLQYEFAYGGENRINREDPAASQVEVEYHLTPDQRQQHPDGPEQAPLAHTAYNENPVGIGFAEKWYLDATQTTRLPAPQIESPEDPIKEFGKQYVPQSLGVITKAWLPRRKLGGTADEEFAKSERCLPEDFDFAFWNGAHPDMQRHWLKGGERVELKNLFPTGTAGTTTDKDGDTVFDFVVPEEKPYLFVKFEEGGIVLCDLKIDTVLIDTNNNKVTLTYRTVLWKEPEIDSLAAKVLSKEDQAVIDEWLSRRDAPVVEEVQRG
ncbi:MAG: DUF2169 domain-containing protein [Verrucomicrobia bacterium]|nr:DUF2169 domain-containing protein [Deltaproteobacteria bacterium]